MIDCVYILVEVYMYLLEGKFLAIFLAVPLGIIVTVVGCTFVNSVLSGSCDGDS